MDESNNPAEAGEAVTEEVTVVAPPFPPLWGGSEVWAAAAYIPPSGEDEGY